LPLDPVALAGRVPSGRLPPSCDHVGDYGLMM
jgi:hypothetical protein